MPEEILETSFSILTVFPYQNFQYPLLGRKDKNSLRKSSITEMSVQSIMPRNWHSYLKQWYMSCIDHEVREQVWKFLRWNLMQFIYLLDLIFLSVEWGQQPMPHIPWNTVIKEVEAIEKCAHCQEWVMITTHPKKILNLSFLL